MLPDREVFQLRVAEGEVVKLLVLGVSPCVVATNKNNRIVIINHNFNPDPKPIEGEE